ncbi:MAG: hypothetical protein WCH39_20335 [Schlesneria sp.]
MTFDVAFKTAIILLGKKGELSNEELLCLVDQNDEIFRQLRKKLIETGYAEYRLGRGLLATQNGADIQTDGVHDTAPQPIETNGSIEHSIFVSSEESDVGPPISFSEADFLPLSSEKPKVISSSQLPVSQSQPVVRQEPDDERVPEPLDLVKGPRQFASRLYTSKLNLFAMGLFVIVLAATGIQWRSSPDAYSVYQEFRLYFDQVKELRSQSVSDPVQWHRAVSQSRSRVQSIVKALKDTRTGASAQRPEKQALLWAGNDSLAKLLDSPAVSKKDEEKLNAEFEFHMNEAKRLLEGGTRIVPAKQITPITTPGAGKPYLGQ